ncbi:MAG: arginine--tRNA ligase [Aggregatilineales bacterium]
MKLLSHEIADLVRRALVSAQADGALPDFPIPELPISRPKHAEQGDYASNVGLQLQKAAGKKPLELAQIVRDRLPSADFIAAAEVAPPGFLNFRLSNAWLASQIDHILAAGDQVFQSSRGGGKTAQVEFVSANPTGPVTVGRSRGGVMGDTLANLLAAVGYRVTREYYFNNAGQQMQTLAETLRARYLELLGLPFAFPEKGYKGDYLRWIAAALVAEHNDDLADSDWHVFKEHAERAIFTHLKSSLRRVNIKFDVFFNEHSLYEDGAIWQVVNDLRAKDAAYDQDSAVWFAASKFGDEKDRVLIKRTGEPAYRLPDIAYHVNKLSRGFDLIIDIFGADHAAEAPQVKRALTALGYDPSPIHTLIHQFVTLVEGGAQKRMSTRRGEYVTLDELIDDVGADAVRYFMLARSPDAHMEFDLALARAQGDENPVYRIQIAHVRCAGIMRKAAERGLTDDDADLSLLSAEELAVVRKMLELGEVIDYAVDNLAPHQLAFYAVDLAGVFNPIYDRYLVLSDLKSIPAPLAKARLRFYHAAKVVFKRALTLMGMSAPEIMERREKEEKADAVKESDDHSTDAAAVDEG